jgi:hypothetical protein
MAQISGSYRHGTRPNVAFEATQEDDGEKWSVIVRSGTQCYEASTWAPSPWPTIERLVADALDGTDRDVEPAKFDMNKRLVKRPVAPTPLRGRRRASSDDLPKWEPPEA